MGHLPGAAPQRTWAGTRHMPAPCCQTSVDSTPSLARGPHLGQRRQPRGRLGVPHVRLGGPDQQGIPASGTEGLVDAIQLLGVAHL